MIRGAIDYIASDRVGGWLFAEEGSTKTRTVLAFLDGACIGAGKVEQYREDLADAGLGDGYVGFNFGIAPIESDDQPRVTVRLEGSDVLLVQKGASIANLAAQVPVVSSAKSPRAVEWMHDQGWLTHDEYDFFRQLGTTGGYERSLRQAKADGAGLEAPAPIAAEYLGLIAQDAVTLSEIALNDAADLVSRRAALLGELGCTIVAIGAEEKGEITVTKAATEEDEDDRATSFTVGPDRLLLLDLTAEIAADEAGGRLTLWGVERAEA